LAEELILLRNNQRICVVCSNILKANLRLQPYRYILEVSLGLSEQNFDVTIITNGNNEEPTKIHGLPVIQLPTVQLSYWKSSRLLNETIKQINPSCVLWHVSLSSFVHQDFSRIESKPIIGIFTSPIYSFSEILRPGIKKLLTDLPFTVLNITTSLVPRDWLPNSFQKSGFHCFVVQTQSTRLTLQKENLWKGDIEVISPGVDEIWSTSSDLKNSHARICLGYKENDIVVVYHSSPQPLRGITVLLEAAAMANKENRSIHLLILSRRNPGKLDRRAELLNTLVKNEPYSKFTKVIEGFLSPEELARYIQASDIVALPFELVPADAPLSLLEVLAMGKPLITTKVACLPELAQKGKHYLVEPSDSQSLKLGLLEAVNDLVEQRVVACDKLPRKIKVRDWDQVGSDWSRLIRSI
jgi:glycosyltransferase involved in cell wall biosynthesis